MHTQGMAGTKEDGETQDVHSGFAVLPYIARERSQRVLTRRRSIIKWQ